MFALMIFILLSLIIVVFAVQNAAIVPVQFLYWSTDLPLVLVIFCSVFAGALLMFFLAVMREFKHKMNKRPQAERKAKKVTVPKEPEKDPIDLTGLKEQPMESGTETLGPTDVSK